ncbi:MAG TPA: hypothetical protein VIO38_11770 [Rariglobus sp.]
MTQWKRVGSATKPTITTDNTAPLSGNVMLSEFGKVATVAYFPAVTLQNPGDYIKVRCNVRYASKQATNTTGPTLALYDSKGTQLAADHTGAADGVLPASLTDDRGYKAYKSFETASDLVLYRNHLGFAPLRFTTLNPSVSSIGTGSTITLNTVYTLSLKIELAANGYDLLITSTFGSFALIKTVAGTDVLTKTFDEIGVNLWGGDYSSSGVMDNVTVTTNRPAIPAGTTSSFHDNLDTGFTQWKRIGSATKPSVGTDNTTPLSGNVLQFNYAKVASVGYFRTVTLKWPGDYIQASYNVRYTAKQTTNTTGPTLALYHSQGTELTADHAGAADGTLPASLTDDRGYKAYKSFETANDLVLFKNHLGFAPLRYTNLNTSLATVGTGTGIALNSVHTLALKIELAANGNDLLITSTFNGSSQTQTVTGADVLTKSFNEIGVNLWGGDYSGAGVLDNVVVFTNVNIPAGAAALGYTRIVIDERPKLADLAPGKTGNYKWFRGATWTATQPPASNFTETNGVLTLLQKADGTTNSLVGAPHDFAGGVFPRLLGSEGFYVEFDVSLSTNDTDHWPAVWLMPAEHNLSLDDVYPDLYPSDPSNYERWMELDVDEGGFRPGMLGSVISWQGQWNQNGGYTAVTSNSWVAGGQTLDRTQRHTFGASYDPVHQRVTWWLDGVKFYTADNTVTANCISPVAELQSFYPILGAQAHGPWKTPPTPAVPYSMYIHAVRAYIPE